MLQKQEVGRLHLLEVSSNFTSRDIGVYNRYTQIWQGMGGKRPQVLKHIESLLWQLIIYLARSPWGDTVGVLKTCFGQIDGFIGEGVNVADIDWFDNGDGFQSYS